MVHESTLKTVKIGPLAYFSLYSMFKEGQGSSYHDMHALSFKLKQVRHMPLIAVLVSRHRA